MNKILETIDESKLPFGAAGIFDLILPIVQAKLTLRELLCEEFADGNKRGPAGFSSGVDLLGHLFRADPKHPLSLSDLGRLSGFDPMTVSQSVKSLREKKCVTVRKDPEDKRKKRVRIVQQGRKAYEPFLRLEQELLRRLRREWGYERAKRFLEHLSEYQLIVNGDTF